MKITIEHKDGKYPSFDVLLWGEGEEPFLTVKGCRIVDGPKGAFVSFPATKNQTTGKYWNHCYASKAFGDAVLKKAMGAPKPKPRIEQSDDDLPPF